MRGRATSGCELIIGMALVALLAGACGEDSAPSDQEVAPPAAVAAVPDSGQGGATEAKAAPVELSGTIERIVGSGSRQGRPMVIKLDVDGARREVRLAPAGFLVEHGLGLAVGDRLRVDGVRKNVRGKEVVVARRVDRGGTSVELRDADGKPRWPRAAGAPSRAEGQGGAPAGDDEDS